MKILCEEVKSRIPLAMLGELSAAEQIELETHLLNCPACAAEQASCVETLSKLRELSDVSVPRHFFVYPDEKRRSLKDLFLALRPGWRLASAMGLIIMFVLLTLLLTRFQLKVESGSYSLTFGKPAPASSTNSMEKAAEIQALKSQLVELLEARSREDRQELTTLLNRELADYSRGLSVQQKKEWKTALVRLEDRLTKQIDGNALTLQSGMKQSVVELYQTVQSQRLQDMNRTRKQLDRMVYQEDQKDQETREILAALLQVADMRLK